VNPAGGYGQFLVNGTASLGGTLTLTSTAGVFQDGTAFDVIVSDVVGGAFDRLNLPNTPILTFTEEQQGGVVSVDVDVASFTTVADNTMENAIAGLLDELTSLSTGELADIIGQYQQLALSDFNRAFGSINPYGYGEAARELAFNTQMGFAPIQRRMDGLRVSALTSEASAAPYLAMAGADKRLSSLVNPQAGAWTDGWGRSFAERANLLARPETATGLYEGRIGYDSLLGDDLVAGFGMDYSESRAALGSDMEEGSAREFKGYVYGGYTAPSLSYFDFALFSGKSFNQHEREIDIADLHGGTSSEYSLRTFSAYLETGKLFGSVAQGATEGRTVFQPFVSASYIRLEQDAFTEDGGGPLAMRIAARNDNLVTAGAGLRMSKLWAGENWLVRPDLSLTYRYDVLQPDYETTASFVSAPGHTFTVKGERRSPQGLGLGLSLDVARSRDVRFKLDATGELREEANRYDLEVGMEYRF
jgi:outer membrane autotransporter protein